MPGAARYGVVRVRRCGQGTRHWVCFVQVALRGMLRPVMEQINFEMLHISKCSFSRKMRLAVESTPRCGALHFRAALDVMFQ